MNFFTSDLHMDHEAILKYTERGAYLDTLYDEVTIDVHAQWVIDTINEHVGEKDNLYLLGDLVMTSNPWKAGYLISQIRCRHKHLILGNHDDSLKDFYLSQVGNLFESVNTRLELKLNKKRIILDHHPIAEWNAGHNGSWHLHGHSHGNFDYKAANLHDKRILDVGWDNAGKQDILGTYRPFEFADIEKYMEGRVSIPHHGKVD